jgi:hypothetical protein
VGIVLAGFPSRPRFQGQTARVELRDCGLSSCVRQIRNCDQIHRPTSDITSIAIMPSTKATAIAHMVELSRTSPPTLTISLWDARALIHVNRLQASNQLRRSASHDAGPASNIQQMLARCRTAASRTKAPRVRRCTSGVALIQFGRLRGQLPLLGVLIPLDSRYRPQLRARAEPVAPREMLDQICAARIISLCTAS